MTTPRMTGQNDQNSKIVQFRMSAQMPRLLQQLILVIRVCYLTLRLLERFKYFPFGVVFNTYSSPNCHPRQCYRRYLSFLLMDTSRCFNKILQVMFPLRLFSACFAFILLGYKLSIFSWCFVDTWCKTNQSHIFAGLRS